MWTFVEQNDLSDKNVVALCTSGGSGISGAEKDLKAMHQNLQTGKEVQDSMEIQMKQN